MVIFKDKNLQEPSRENV